MGNCCRPVPIDEERNSKEMSKESITVMTFASPQNYFESFNDTPPTFSEPQFFLQNKKSVALQSFSKEALQSFSKESTEA